MIIIVMIIIKLIIIMTTAIVIMKTSAAIKTIKSVKKSLAKGLIEIPLKSQK